MIHLRPLIIFELFYITIAFKTILCNKCTERETCGECIAEDPQCAWCTEEDFSKGDAKRCDYLKNLEGKCNIKNIVAPVGVTRLIKDFDLSDQGAKEDEAIQMRPQEIKIRLRPNMVQKFQVQFRQAVDYPIDLYYLMDLSNSMENDKLKLAKLGNQLADEMKTITTNFRLGFGSFVDKKMAPYANPHPTILRAPCASCAAPYGYHNNMPLSSLTQKFATEVEKAPISGNVDPPEGGFDALMQAIVCEKEIGWRNNSRKLLVLSTDDSFHYAGDGKLGGIIAPNDEKCHLDNQGFYTMSTQQDYPSLGQLNKQMKEHKINLIFAVESSMVKMYQTLSKRLVGSKTGELADDSSNVVDLVRQQYNEITSSVKMTDNIRDSNIEISYYSSCFGEKKEKTNVCRDLKVGKNVTFEVNLKFSECPQDPRKINTTFQIFPEGLQDHLKVHLEMICECECEQPWNEEERSPKCSNGNGTYECGICNCNRLRSGKECECDTSERENFVEFEECYNGNDTRICSGAGDCICGRCKCWDRPNNKEKVWGDYCERNNYNCDEPDGILCGGHGKCDTGSCDCFSGWKGDSCTCRDTIETCMAPNGEICSGHGACDCGVCKCDNNDYFGTFCDDCSRCPGMCSELRECVECFLDSQKDENLNCSICERTQIHPVHSIEVKEKEKACPMDDKKNCRFVFKYAFDEKSELKLWVKMTKECPTPVDVVAIAAGVAGGVVATGLFLLMLWKALTVIHDRREWAKFEKDRLMAKWNQGQNPLYKEVQTTYQNPAYSGAVATEMDEMT